MVADTLVTRLNASGEFEPVDYTLKNVQFSSKDMKSFVSCSFAGNRALSFFFFKKIQNAIEEGVLSTDINQLLLQIPDFLKETIISYEGSGSNRICKMIFAGISLKTKKLFNLKNLSKAIGNEAGHINDRFAVQGISSGFVDVPDQKMFSFLIDERVGKFGIEEIGDMYSVITGGSADISEEEKRSMVKHFATYNTIEKESQEIIQYFRNNFSKTIGGAITLSYMENNDPGFHHAGYVIDRQNPNFHVSNWSLNIENMHATDPEGKVHDLVKSFYSLNNFDNNCDMQL